METLPTEIHFRILELLLQRDYLDVFNYEMVCKRFRDTVVAWKPWKKLCIERGYVLTSAECLLHEDSTSHLVLDASGSDSVSPAHQEWVAVDVSDDESPSEDGPDDQGRLVPISPEFGTIVPLVEFHDLSSNNPRESADVVMESEWDGWKQVFIHRCLEEQAMTDGACQVQGSHMRFSSMSTMQIHGDRVFGGFNEFINIWDITSGTQLRRLQGHSNVITCISVQAPWIVSASQDLSVRIWDLDTLTEIRQFETPAVVKIVRFNRRELIVGTELGHVVRYDLRSESSNQEHVIPHAQQPSEVKHLLVNDHYLCSMSDQGNIKVMRRSDNVVLLNDVVEHMHPGAMSLNTYWLAIGSTRGALRVWRLSRYIDAAVSVLDSNNAIEAQNQVDIGSSTALNKINAVQILIKNSLFQDACSPALIACAKESGRIEVWTEKDNTFTQTLVVNASLPILCLELRRHVPEPDQNPDKRRRYNDQSIQSKHHICIAAVGLDGKIYRWLLEDDQARVQVHALDPTLSFSSSFLPIMLYQNSIQQMMRPPVAQV